MDLTSAEHQCAGHLFGPLLIRSPNPRFLHDPFVVGDMDQPLSSRGYGMAPFRLGIWTGPFPVGDMDRPLSSWDMEWPLSSWGYGVAPFQLGMWTCPFLIGNMDLLLLSFILLVLIVSLPHFRGVGD